MDMQWRIESGGDAVPGGYNGYFIAYAPDGTPDGTPAGYLDYQSATGDDEVLIAMVEVQPAHRRKGLATLLLARLREEFPGRTVRPGYQTADGAAWWRAVGARRPRTTREDRGSQLRTAGGAPWTEAMTRAWFTPQAADRPDDLPRGIAVPRARTQDVAQAAIGVFLELRGGLGGDEEEARRRAVEATVAKEAARERHGGGILTTYDGTPWTDAMGQALFDLRAADRPTDLPWNLGVPPARVRALADDAIGLLLEYRDQHGRDEEQARLEAVAEVVEGEEARELIEWPGDHHRQAPHERGERGEQVAALADRDDLPAGMPSQARSTRPTSPAERRDAIAHAWRNEPGITGTALAERFGVSGRTIQRDIQALQDRGERGIQEAQPHTRAWVSYLEYGGEWGTRLAHGHVVAGAGGGHVLIRPENAGPEGPLVRKHWSQVDYQPLRREGETIELDEHW